MLDVGARNGAKPTDHLEDKGAVTIDDAVQSLLVRPFKAEG